MKTITKIKLIKMHIARMEFEVLDKEMTNEEAEEELSSMGNEEYLDYLYEQYIENLDITEDQFLNGYYKGV